MILDETYMYVAHMFLLSLYLSCEQEPSNSHLVNTSAKFQYIFAGALSLM